MKIEEMVEEMNKAADGTLSMAHFEDWELGSYKDYSLFSISKGRVVAKSFKELIEKGYERLKEEEVSKE